MSFRNFAVIASLFFLTSCNCGAPMRITPIQRGDKQLKCKDIILEINEVEHRRDKAYRSKDISASSFIFPFCAVSGYMKSGEAVEAAEERVEYLNNIYNLLNCGGDDRFHNAPRPPAVTPPSGGVPTPSPTPNPSPTPPPAPTPPVVNAPVGSPLYPPSSPGFSPYPTYPAYPTYPSSSTITYPPDSTIQRYIDYYNANPPTNR